MDEFTPERSDAIRARIIDHVARELHQESTSDSAAHTSVSTGVRSSRYVGRGRGHRAQWVAASIALLLVGGVTAAAITTAIYGGAQTAANPTDTVPPFADDADTYVGSGIVIERDGVVQLCVGGHFQSRPPGCMVPVVLVGWEWDQAPVTSQEANGVRFTEQDVTVTGTVRPGDDVTAVPTLTLSEAPVAGRLSSPSPDAVTSVSPSGLSHDELEQIIQGSLGETIGLSTAMIVDGVIQAYVALDDGTRQQAADARYGPGVVYVASLLSPAEQSVPGPPDQPREQRSAGTILLAASERPTQGMDARIAGTLTRLDGGCLALEVGQGRTHVLEFPFGSTLSPDGMSVTVPDYGIIRVGDEIVGGGGYTSEVVAPEECRVSEDFVVWQTVSVTKSDED